MATATTTYPDIFYATWVFAFIDDELAEIPQRTSQAYPCKFIKTGDFYESRISLSPTDPYNLKNSLLNYGIIGNISTKGYVHNVGTFFTMIRIEHLPLTQFESHIDGNTLKVNSRIATNSAEDAIVDFRYTFVNIKNNRLLTGYELKVPIKDAEKYIDYQRACIKQMQNGL